jgi:LysM repeat protein
MTAAGVFLLVAASILGYNIWPKGDDTASEINSRLELVGTQTQDVSFGGSERIVLGDSTSAQDEADDQPVATPAPNPTPTPTPASSSDQFTSYTVKAGDTLFNISQSYGVKWDLIAQFNNLQEPYLLHGGQVLRIPQGTTSSVPNKIYTIVKGDTLASIAKKYNVTVNDIIAVNPNLQKSDLISIGQVIKLP